MGTKDNIPGKEDEHLPAFFRKENPFSSPPDYFDRLPREVMGKITRKTAQPSFTLSPAFSFASLAILSAIAFFLLLLPMKKTSPHEDYILSENDIEYILDNHRLYNLDEHTVADQFLSMNHTEEVTELQHAEISEDEIQDYLEENTSATNIINSY